MEETRLEYLCASRFSLAVLMGMGYAFAYILRADLSVAIVCMVKEPFHNNTDAFSANWTEIYSDECAADASRSTLTEAEALGEFEWSKKLQALLLGSFYYGYIITQIPGGLLAARFGSKKVFGGVMAINAIATLLTPVAARLHAYLVVALRVLMGLAQGACFSTTHHMWGRWAPPLERTKLVAFSYAGTAIGTIVAMSLSGFICQLPLDGGWPLIFYIYGCACGVWCMAWFCLVADTPTDHPRITEKERDYIINSVGSTVYKRSVKPPLKAILRSRAVWALTILHVCSNWGLYTVLTCIPLYMKEVLRFDIKSNGLLSALPFLATYISLTCTGWLADWVRSKHYLRTVTVRKVWAGVGYLSSGLCIVVMGFMTCVDRYIAVVLLTMTFGLYAIGRAAYSANHVDLAPRYSGFLFGFTNTAGSLPGFITPNIVALLTPNGTQSEWQKVFFITGAIYAFGAIVFIAFGQGEEQPWATRGERSKAKEDGGECEALELDKEVVG